MVSASLLRAQIESALAPRVPVVFSTGAQVRRPLQTTGIEALDHLLGGGLPDRRGVRGIRAGVLGTDQYRAVVVGASNAAGHGVRVDRCGGCT